MTNHILLLTRWRCPLVAATHNCLAVCTGKLYVLPFGCVVTSHHSFSGHMTMWSTATGSEETLPDANNLVSSSSHGWEGMSQLHSKICHLHVALVNRGVQSLLSLHGRGSQLMTWLFWTRQIWYATITLGFINVKELRAPGKTPAGILITATRDHFMWHKRRASIWIGILRSWALITMRYGAACHELAPTEDS